MKRPLLLGHRGARASRSTPENTLASFELSLQHGCDGFEFDVRGSKDGQAVICHDPVLRGMEIANTAAAALNLPTLGEVLQRFGGRAFLDIELKVGGLEQETLGLLRKHPPRNGYVVSSFVPKVLFELSRLDPAIPLGFIFEAPNEMDGWTSLPVSWVMPQAGLVTQSLVTVFHDAGKKVMVWTANDADEIQALVEWGVDAVITDDTQLAVTGTGSEIVI